MKKLFIILLVCISFQAKSQLNLTYTFDVSTMVTDTFVTFSHVKDQITDVQFKIQGIAGGVGTFTVYNSSFADSTLITAYNNIDAAIFPKNVSSLVTDFAIQKTNWGGKRLGLYFTKGTLTAGTITIVITANKKD